MLGVVVWPSNGGKVIHTEIEKQMFDKKRLLGPAETMGQDRKSVV